MSPWEFNRPRSAFNKITINPTSSIIWVVPVKYEILNQNRNASVGEKKGNNCCSAAAQRIIVKLSSLKWHGVQSGAYRAVLQRSLLSSAVPVVLSGPCRRWMQRQPHSASPALRSTAREKPQSQQAGSASMQPCVSLPLRPPRSWYAAPPPAGRDRHPPAPQRSPREAQSRSAPARPEWEARCLQLTWQQPWQMVCDAVGIRQ